MNYQDLNLSTHDETSLLFQVKTIIDKQQKWNIPEAWFKVLIDVLAQKGFKIVPENE